MHSGKHCTDITLVIFMLFDLLSDTVNVITFIFTVVTDGSVGFLVLMPLHLSATVLTAYFLTDIAVNWVLNSDGVNWTNRAYPSERAQFY